MLLGVVFLTRVIVDNVSSFLLYPRALHVSLARVLDFSLMVTTHNSTVLKVNSMTEDIFVCIFFGQKVLVSGRQTQKALHTCPQYFCLFFLVFLHAPTLPS